MIAKRLLQRGIRFTERHLGEIFIFRDKKIIMLMRGDITQKDFLKYDRLPTDFVKLQVRADLIEGEPPRKGEYIYKGERRYRIVDSQYIGDPSRVYLIDCSGDRKGGMG